MKDLNNTELLKHGSFINGQWQTSDDYFPVFNPATNETISNVAEVTPDQVEQAITAANKAQLSWQNTTSYKRAAKLQRWAALIDEHSDDLARIMTREQGKTLADASGEIAYAKSFIDWFAEEAKRVYGDTISQHADNKAINVIKQPVGVVAAITPWNFPTAMITRKAAAALAAGCTIVIKPASETPHSALALAVLAEQAGIPEGVFNIVVGKDSRTIGEQLTQHPLIKKFTFTGSTKIGKLLNKQCAKSVKKVSLELGGNAPFIVYDDADISIAVKALIDAKLRNCGQTCISPNRIYLHRPIAQAFKDKLVAQLNKVTQGNGEAAESDVACLIHQEAAENVHKLVESAKDAGGEILLGGLSQPPSSSFYPLTVIDKVTHNSDITQCEIFGPVFALITFDEPEQAIEQANDTEFGLASYVFSQNINRLQQTTTALNYGMIGVNDTAISHPIAPFGGIKHSGFGKEGSKYGLDDYLIIKAITYGF